MFRSKTPCSNFPFRLPRILDSIFSIRRESLIHSLLDARPNAPRSIAISTHVQPTGLHGIGTSTLLFMDWINGTVLCTVSPQPSMLQLCSRRTFRSSKSANCHKWWTVFNSPICTNQAPTPSMTSRRALSPRRQCVSHSSRFPG